MKVNNLFIYVLSYEISYYIFSQIISISKLHIGYEHEFIIIYTKRQYLQENLYKMIVIE